MKRFFYLFAVISTLFLGGVWMASRNQPSGAHKDPGTNPLPKKRERSTSPFDGIAPNDGVARSKKADQIRLDAEEAELRTALFQAAKDGDSVAFRSFLGDLMDRFKGDPRPIVGELVIFLGDRNTDIVIAAAASMLRAGIDTKEATAALMAILKVPEPVPAVLDGESVSDIRVGIARLLSIYPDEGVSEAIWNLYQQTHDERLFEDLLRLRNPNLPGEIIPRLGDHGKVIDYAPIIGGFKIQEALGPLLNWYQNGYFMKKGDPRNRGKVIWALWQVTGDERYFADLLAFPGGPPVEYLASAPTPASQKYLTEMLQTAGSDRLEKVLMALHLKFSDPPEMKEFLHDILSKPSSPPISIPLFYHLVGAVNDPDLSRLAADHDDKSSVKFWPQYGVYRKGWAFPEWAGGPLEIR